VMILLTIKSLILDPKLIAVQGEAALWFSSSTTTEHYDLDRLKHDDRIEQQRLVLNVIQIVTKLFNCVFDRSPIGILNLRPAGKAWLHNVALRVVRNDRSQLLDEHRALRAWAHEIHLSADHVDELRELVESQLPNDASNPGNARIVFFGPNRT